ncbi:MAG: methylated-DNA--[protein]-cysteine S-methyltransferase [Bacteroidota bacterium]
MYTYNYDSPVGQLSLTSDGDSLTGLSFASKADQEIAELPVFEETIRQLEEYFAGKRKTFDLPLNNIGTDFQQKVWDELMNIPFGTSVTYKDLSIKLGDLKAIRAVGTANGKNNIAIIVPCHRVIGSDGSLTGYAWGVDKKKWLLRHEGHPSFQQEQMSLF